MVSHTTFCVRLSQLPTEFYDRKVLEKIGKRLGRLRKIDACTSTTFRGRYARLCIKVPLDHPVKNEIQLESLVQKVVYKGEGILCTRCGKLGHVLRNCNKIILTEKESQTPSTSKQQQNKSKGHTTHERAKVRTNEQSRDGTCNAKEVSELPLQGRGATNSSAHSRPIIPCLDSERGSKPWDRKPRESSLDPNPSPNSTTGGLGSDVNPCHKHANGTDTADHALFPNESSGGSHEESIICPMDITQPPTLNCQTGDPWTRGIEERVVEPSRESNEELELLLASFGEQRNQVIVLEKLLLKELEEFTKEVTLVICPMDTSLCSLKLKSEWENSPTAFALKPLIDL
ncbi:hypothetical protein KY284_007816 [Solanum tuberosum]|nr:hypothetical protein KY284_007816 [Solanum tuberosum]